MGAAFNFPALGMTTTIVEGNFILVDDPRTGKPIKIKVEDFLGSAADRGLLTQPVEPTPDTIVEFDQLTPTTGGVVFTPNTPATESILYVSTVDASTWIYEGGAYITKTYVSSANTPFYLLGTTVDAGGNKTAAIQHLGPLRATTFTGNGLNITGINAANLATGTIATIRMGTGAVGAGDKYLADNNTWKTVSSGGIFGISNSNGVYTYYSTLTLAMASAVSGDTVEMFADYNETGAVSITMKAGVIIQGNGHSYNHSHASATHTFLFPTNANYYIYNLQVNRTNATSGAYVFYHVAYSPYTVYCNGTTIRTNKGGVWWHFSQPGNVYNLTIEFSGSGDVGISGSGSNVNNCTIIGTSSSSNILANSGCVLNNCNVLNRGTGITVGECYINNTTVNSLASAACNGAYGVSNSYIYSATSYGLLLYSNGLCRNSVIISAGGYGAYIYNANSRYDNCLIWSTVNNAFYAGLGGDLKFNNCVLLSSASVALNAHSVEATNCTIESLWANAGGHAVAITSSDSVITNCMLRTANTSANAIYAASAFTIKFANNVYANMTTPINVSITQGITNTHDNQGNILI